MTLVQIAGLITLVLSALCTGGALAGWYMFRHSEVLVGQRMRHYLLAHGLVLFITMLFGLAGFIHAPEWFWHALYYARVVFLSLEGFCLVTLVMEFYTILNKPNRSS